MSKVFDEMVDASWRRYEERLLEGMRRLPDGYLQIDRAQPDDQEGPLITVDWDEDGFDATLEGLSAEHDPAIVAALGWTPPHQPEADPMWTAHLSAEEAELLAGLVSGTLRRAFGIVGPNFVVDNVSVPPAEPRQRPGTTHAAESVEEGPAIMGYPSTAEELTGMVEKALERQFPAPVIRDDDGDFPILSGVVPIWVRISPAAPRVRLFSYFVDSIKKTAQARTEVDILNRRTPFLKFALENDCIKAVYELPAVPFVGTQLLHTLDHMSALLNEIAADTALRVGGHLWFEGLDTPARPDGRQD